MRQGTEFRTVSRGAVWMAPFSPCLNQNHVFCVRPHSRLHSEWISLSTNARYARNFFFLHSNQSTNLASISKTNTSEFPIAMPPDDEILGLLRQITNRLNGIDRALERVRHCLDSSFKRNG